MYEIWIAHDGTEYSNVRQELETSTRQYFLGNGRHCFLFVRMNSLHNTVNKCVFTSFEYGKWDVK